MADDRRQQIAQALWEASDGYEEQPVAWENNYARSEWYRMADALLPLIDRVAAEAAAEAWDDGYRAAETDALGQPYSDMPEADTWQPRRNPHRAAPTVTEKRP